jgi:transcriptional regulator with PAS, ATPase and Fis domain
LLNGKLKESRVTKIALGSLYRCAAEKSATGSHLAGEKEMIRERSPEDFQTEAGIVGQSRSLLRAVEKLPAIARSDVGVLICGESGTGKELVARAIHYLSERAPFAFMAVNCGSFPDGLLESEFFGHERGAFTGAHSRRDGLIAQANRGTLFLDEVDSLTMKAQVNLLRVLQDKKFRCLGSTAERESNVRFIAASNRPVSALVQSGSFREDLYYRLCVFTVFLPPLRERKDDILPLAAHFLRKHAPAKGVAIKLSPEVRSALEAYEWPGNIRELENTIIRGLYLSRNGTIELEDIGLTLPESAKDKSRVPQSFKAAKQEAVEAFEREYLGRLMQEHGGNVSHAARAAGKDRRDLGRLLKKYQLDTEAGGLRATTIRWNESDASNARNREIAIPFIDGEYIEP